MASTLTQILQGTGPGGYDQFGLNFACVGDWIAVGANCWDNGVAWCGRVFMCQMESGLLVVKQELDPPAPDQVNSRGFGSWVGMNPAATELMVAAPWYSSHPGKIFRFVLSGSTWIPHGTQPEIQRYDYVTGSDYWGLDGAYDGTHLLASWVVSSVVGNNIDVLELVGDTWTHTQRLSPSDQFAKLNFGESYQSGMAVAIYGDTIAVGASPTATYGDCRGYVFTKSGGTWTERCIFAPSLPSEDYCSVKLRDDTILFSHMWGSADTCGEMFVFRGSGATWAETQIISCPAEFVQNYGGWGGWFGVSAAWSSDGTLLAVGAKNVYQPGPPVVGSFYDGALFLFNVSGDGTITHRESLFEPLPGEVGGFCVGFWPPSDTPTHLIGGAYSYDSDVDAAGALIVYELPTPVCFRTPLGALYVDELRDLTIDSGMLLTNTVPELDETDVPHDQLLHLTIVSVDNVAIDATTKVYITRSSDQTRRLAYDAAAGGFQAPYNGSLSLATAQASPGAAVDDELVLRIDFTGSYESLETVLVEISSSTALANLVASYSFTIEDLTAPSLVEILWLTPRRCRVKWSEAVSAAVTPGGALFVQACLGSVEVVPTVATNAREGDPGTQVYLASQLPSSTWIGFICNMSGSAYPSNNAPRPITEYDATTKRVTLATSTAYGGLLRADDGNDWDDTDRAYGVSVPQKGTGILVRQRKLQASVSPYWLSARLTAEGASSPVYSADRVQCAYCPVPIAASQPTAAELQAGEDPAQYTYIDWNDDISYGRLYTLHASGVADVFGNRCVDSQLDHTTPWFGAPLDRITLWSKGMLAPPNRTEDLERDKLLRKLVVVMQDVLNMLWNRVDVLQHVRDPGKCPDELVDFLLYEMGNPFRYPLTAAQKRLLVSSLPVLYKQIGTEQGIENFLERLLGIKFEITPYVEGDFWTLGIDRLGLTTMLGPSTAVARNSYEIYSPVTLSTDQRRVVTDTSRWADPYNMHLARIVEPGMTPGPGGSYWILGISTLGVSTMLGGS